MPAGGEDVEAEMVKWLAAARWAIGALLILCAAAFAPLASAQAAETPFASAVASLAGPLAERGECTSVAVGTNERGTPGFYAYGEVARGGGGAPTPKTEFEIGSITKVFTTTLLAIDAQRGTVKLDDPLQKYMPQGIKVPSFGGRQITLVDLATHTSGLPRQPQMQGESYSDSDMFRFLNSYQLTRAPGTQFEYSNLGVALLAHALEQATDTPWAKQVRQEVTEKLGMPDTRLAFDNQERARLAIGYTRRGMPARENMPTWPAFNGAGALLSTISDMQRFLAWNMGELKGDLPDGLVSELHKTRFPLPRARAGVGLAWQIAPLGASSSVVWKNGGTLGYSSDIGFVPGARVGIVLLANSNHCPLTRAGQQILGAVTGQGGEPEGVEGGD